MDKFFGTYRGKVENNLDPQNLGRVQVSCPAVLGEGRNSWAMPCTPYAGPGVGLFTVPPVGANVWVEFEAGDPNYPILAGCFWGLGEAPVTPALAHLKILKTDVAKITINDLPGAGGITIETATGMKIVIDSVGIEITNGMGASLKLKGLQTSINDGALEVT